MLVMGREVNGVVILEPKDGKLGRSGDDLAAAVQTMLDEGEKRILIDLAIMTSVDVTSLGEIVMSHVKIGRACAQMRLVNAPHVLILELRKLNLEDAIPNFDDEAEAIASFRTS